MRADPAPFAPTARLLSEAELVALQPQWTARTSAMEGATFFAGPMFQGALRQTVGSGREALAVFHGENLAALMPLQRHSLGRGPIKLREAGFPRNAHTLRNHLLMAPEAATVEALLGAWWGLAGLDTLLIENIPKDGVLPGMLVALARKIGLGADDPTPGRELLHADTGADFEAFLATRSGQFRRQLRKRQRELEAVGELAVESLRGGAILEALQDWRGVVDASWQGAESAEDAANTGADWALHGALAESGRLWLARLDGRPVAALRMLEDARAAYVHTMHYDQGLRDHAPGLVLFEAMMRDACARGLPRVDFNGSSDFFARWATGVTRHVSVRIYRPGIRGRGAQMLRGVLRRQPAPSEAG